MERVALSCFISLGLLVAGSADAGDKTPAPRSLVDDAQLLANTPGPNAKGWTSSEEVLEGDLKYNYTILFEPDKGKPSGKAQLGLRATGKEIYSVNPNYTFELTEQKIKDKSYRAIKLTPSNEFFGKPFQALPRMFYYTLEGDKLTLTRPALPGWPDDTLKIQFQRDK